MSRILVVYGTSSGCTEGVADTIGETLTAGGIETVVSPVADSPDPAGYDAVIVGSGVRASQWHGAARTWVTENADTLKAVPVAFFTCGLVINDGPHKEPEVRAYTDALIESSGVTPVDVGLFAGWNNPKAFSMPERLVMKVMKAPQGDFRDFRAIQEWTRTVVDQLGLTEIAR